MILVTGTMRSGTSMWMQILQAAGLPGIGTAYPAYWKEALGDFNPRGFHESRLRAGVWWRTNPHPESGAYLFPEQTRRHVVKVFVEGLVRTDVAFVDGVVCTMRDWRSFTRSFTTLRETERAFTAERELPFPTHPDKLPVPYQWWFLNYELVRDIATRRLPARLTTYDRVVRDPEHEIGRVLEWLGGELDLDAAVACVQAELRTEREPLPVESELDPAAVEVFDRLFATVDAGEAIGPELIAEMNALQLKLVESLRG